MNERILALLLLFPISLPMVCAQNSTTDPWLQIDKRPIPDWFQDAKFGIFIHWGVYSVPAWTPSGTYSEWYQYWLQTERLSGNGDFSGSEVTDFHRRVYGDEGTAPDGDS